MGTVQNIGKPYADLYHDREDDSLLLLVRVTQPSVTPPRYAAISVTPQQVMDYMDGGKNIADIFSLQPYRYALIKDKEIDLDSDVHTSSQSTFLYNKPFEPHFCFNSIQLKAALRRMIHQSN